MAHFLVLAIIASLVPACIPGGLFWAYLTDTAFIVAGISICDLKNGPLGRGFARDNVFALVLVAPIAQSRKQVSLTRSKRSETSGPVRLLFWECAVDPGLSPGMLSTGARDQIALRDQG
jgi:hypothetical protein